VCVCVCVCERERERERERELEIDGAPQSSVMSSGSSVANYTFSSVYLVFITG
jgi:hypothetical protein